MNILLRKIHRLDLVRVITSKVKVTPNSTVLSHPRRSPSRVQSSASGRRNIEAVYNCTPGYIEAIKQNRLDVSKTVLDIFQDFTEDNLVAFKWRVRLPRSKCEHIKNATDLAKALREHVTHDIIRYLETTYDVLRMIGLNNSADKLNLYLFGFQK